MNCNRCNGLMYRMEIKDSKGFGCLRADVCVLCGEMLDPVIAVNRARNTGREFRRPKRAPRRRRFLNKRGFLAIP